MPQHMADGREIDAGLEKRRGCAVPHAVWMESFLSQSWRGFGSGIQASRENVPNSKPAQLLISMVEKWASGERSIFRCLQKDFNTAAVSGHKGQ